MILIMNIQKRIINWQPSILNHSMVKIKTGKYSFQYYVWRNSWRPLLRPYNLFNLHDSISWTKLIKRKFL